MAQKKRKKKPQKPGKTVSPKTDLSSVSSFFDKHPHALPMIILLALLLLFFNQMMFSGKTMLPADKVTSISYEPFVEQSFKNGEYPLWYPYIFSGMPSFASLTRAPLVDILSWSIKGILYLISVIFPLPAFTLIFINYFLLGFFTYLLLIRLTKIRAVALFAAVALTFQPAIIAFSAFGHNTKLSTALLIPLIFLLVEEVLEKRRMFHFSLLALAVGLQMLKAHTQMSYYTFMFIGLFAIYWTVDAIRKKQPVAGVFKSLGVLAAALIIGIAMSSWLYLSVQEYARYSIRGGGGLDYNYASSWSFSPLETLTFFVPSFVGFGGRTYWGHMPFTSFPMYMGIIPLFFAGLALVIRRDRTVWFLGLTAILALLISFGKEFSLLYDLLFRYLPYFNKFRVPSMILILVQFSVVVLAALGLHSLWQLSGQSISMEIKKRIKLYLYVFSGIAGLIFLYLLVAKSSVIGHIAASGKVADPQLQKQSYRIAMNDAVLMIVFLAITIVLLLAWLNQKIKASSFVYAVIAVTVLNLWLTDFKIIDPKPKASKENFFRSDDVVKFLQSDSTQYRILPAFDNRPANWYAYHFIQSATGYHAAKLKIYQDMLEETGFPRSFLLKYLKPVTQNGRQTMAFRSPAEIDARQWRFHQNVLRMLNVKYIVTPYAFSDSSYKPVFRGSKNIFQHLAVLPRAFFVEDVKKVSSKEAVFASLQSADFDPARQALIYKDPPFRVSAASGNRATLTSWENRHLKFDLSAQSNGFLVISEIFYPAGWHAKMDGEEVEIYQTNHILRGVFVPAGQHVLTLTFHPRRFYIGFWITAVLFFSCLAMVAIAYRKGKKGDSI